MVKQQVEAVTTKLNKTGTENKFDTPCSMSRHLYIKMVKRNLSTTLKTHEKCQYLGANIKPSLVLQNHHLDTSIWSQIKIVDTDVFLVSSAKSGSTWMYEVIANLLYQNTDHGYKSWMELCLSPTFSSFRIGGPTEDAKLSTLDTINDQLINTNIKRRIFKLHEPVESMPFNPKCKYIFVSRDFRDIIWSFYNHYDNYSESIMQQINSQRYNYDLKSHLPCFDDLNKHNEFTEHAFWKMSIRNADDFGNPDGAPFWSQLWVIGSWLNTYLDHKHQNIKIVHYNEMKDDLGKVCREIACFLEVEIDENKFDSMVHSCLFETMKAKQEELFGEVGKLWWKEPKDFFNKGVNDRWHGILTQEDTEEYRTLAQRYLTERQVKWLEGNIPSFSL
eukprot:3927_1